MGIDPHQLEKVIFFGKGVQRFTQDSPVMPDVWVEYGLRPLVRTDLLLDSYMDVPPGRVCRVLLKRLKNFTAALPRDKSDRGTEIAFNQSTVVARLYFDELIQIVLPMTYWWNKYILSDPDEWLNKFLDNSGDPTGKPSAVASNVVAHMTRHPIAGHDDAPGLESPPDVVDEEDLPLSSRLLWLIRVVGAIALQARRDAAALANGEPQKPVSFDADAREIVEAARDLLKGCRTVEQEHLAEGSTAPLYEQRSLVWSANRNRPASSMVWLSVPAVKADAAARLFELDCSRLCWGIIDTGVDARHPAFQRRPPERAAGVAGQNPAPAAATPPAADAAPRWRETTRVMATYDFTRIRYILSPDPSSAKQLPKQLYDYFEEYPEKKKELMDRLETGRFIDWEFLLPYFQISHFDKPPAAEPPPAAPAPPAPEAAPSAAELMARADGSKEERPAGVPAVEPPSPSPAPRDERPAPPFRRYYEPPQFNHGTHVAGILAADWPAGDNGNRSGYDIKGMCPDIRLYDLRVLNEKGTGDEFSVIAAMQFVRHLNAHTETKVMHGVNLSLAIRHKVRNYACGCTPVCEESERLVNTGVVVVAAAGNDGYLHFLQPGNLDAEGYRSISITDPGNSEAVITVGATHRDRAHTYGVSFFSSRGPTGDGRLKPDLVAPGEKIVSTVPNRGWDTLDGTSMAAPHVSGAAALLMARYQELIGRPVRIKQILCSTATDLGRERYFQGHGMVDILRAMQSI